AKISEQDVRFLTESALLPVMKPALAAELTGFGAAGEVLARLHRRNTFTTRYDGAAVAYEFHPLFRKYLLDKLERSLDLEALTALQCHAAALLARDGQTEAAMDLLVKARRWPEMAALLREHAAELINQGRHRLMGQWLAQIPDKLFDAEPWLAYWYGACQIFDSAAKSQTWMERPTKDLKRLVKSKAYASRGVVYAGRSALVGATTAATIFGSRNWKRCFTPMHHFQAQRKNARSY
ncbi:MAG TPA: hypothetical protein VHK27_13365, partial [Gammaproteobacteria bacterium]|nr:hypothetical protein [Gammaproteobacteria bacterium]